MRVLSEAGLELAGHTFHLPDKALNIFFLIGRKRVCVCVWRSIYLASGWAMEEERKKMGLLSAKSIRGMGLRCSKKE